MKVKVVMLSTDKATINKGKTTGKLYYDGGIFEEDDGGMPQHLYFCDDSEIKEGDCVLHKDSIKPLHVDDVIYPNQFDDSWNKVIATTDKGLIIYSEQWDTNKQDWKDKLPQIPLSFIESYVDKQVDEVEIEINMPDPAKYRRVGLIERNAHFALQAVMFPTPKLTDNNEVIIVSSKMYSREDVVGLMHRAYNKGTEVSTTRYLNIDKWIEDNL